MVIAELRAGFGVEDIAVKASCTVARVRRCVQKLRAKGVLAEIYGGAK
jgi:DeoR/GlpR family transcriptional regulator of sugar metabolism